MREHGVPAVHGRRAPAGRRVRPARRLLLHRARLHQHAHRARPRRHPAACAPTATDDAPGRDRRRARRLQPRAGRRLHRRRRARRRRAGGAGDHRGRPRAGRPTGGPGGRDGAAACGWRATGGVYVPRSTTSTTCPTAGSSGSRRTSARRAVAGRQAHRDGPRRVAVPEEAAGAARRDRARADARRDLPRLHPRLPVLPGRHDHPPGARALDHRHRRDGRARPGSDRLRGGRPALAVQRRPLARSPSIAKGLADRYEGTQTSLSLPSRPGSTRSTSTWPTSCPATAAAPG